MMRILTWLKKGATIQKFAKCLKSRYRPWLFPSEAMLEARNLSCQRGDRVLFSGLNLSLVPGELLQVAGPNGSGKTSLLKILSGITSPIEGDVFWHGESTRKLGEEFRKNLLYLGHQNAVKEELTALENLQITAALEGYSLSESDGLGALDRIGLVGREYLPAKVLSQGQKRRVALARLLLSGATLWILDEPLTALDARAIELIQSRLAEHLSAGGMVILTTHQPIGVPGVTPRKLEMDNA
jgi:heme exporter protein A